MTWNRKLFAAAAAFLVGACADSAGGPIPYNIALGNPDAPTVAPLGSDYRIAPMDTVSVKVFRSGDSMNCWVSATVPLSLSVISRAFSFSRRAEYVDPALALELRFG